MARLSSKLSPQAKRSALSEDAIVRALVEVAPSAEPQVVAEHLRQAGATNVSWVSKPGYCAIEISSHHLQELADLDEVVYIDMGGRLAV